MTMEPLTDLDTWRRLVAASHHRPVVVFKHSLTCGISGAALSEFRHHVASSSHPEALYAVLEIQRAREVSQEIARETGVAHRSPQALLLADGAVRWHASHWEITRETLADALTS